MTRQAFHRILQKILGSKNVYFQPPAKQRLEYPAIVYSRSPYVPQQADNHGYILSDHYMVTHMTTNPDSPTPKHLAQLPNSRQDQAFKSDGLYHTVFSIYI